MEYDEPAEPLESELEYEGEFEPTEEPAEIDEETGLTESPYKLNKARQYMECELSAEACAACGFVWAVDEEGEGECLEEPTEEPLEMEYDEPTEEPLEIEYEGEMEFTDAPEFDEDTGNTESPYYLRKTQTQDEPTSNTHLTLYLTITFLVSVVLSAWCVNKVLHRYRIHSTAIDLDTLT